VKGSAPSETKKETAHGVIAADAGALITLGTFAHTIRRNMMVVHLDRLAHYEGTAWDERPEGGNNRSS
jgi:hypothetical protein